MPEKGKVKEQPSSVEERLPQWAQTLLKLEAQVESSQPSLQRPRAQKKERPAGRGDGNGFAF